MFRRCRNSAFNKAAPFQQPQLNLGFCDCIAKSRPKLKKIKQMTEVSMSQVFSDKVFYHIYALGMGNCAKRNDFACPAGDFFEKLAGRLDGIRALGCNALLIGPVFESTAHGYDTVDYYHVERRLGNNERFKEFCRLCHEKGFAVVLDAVFNHTGRGFFAF